MPSNGGISDRLQRNRRDSRQCRVVAVKPQRNALGQTAINKALRVEACRAQDVDGSCPTSIPMTEPTSTHDACCQSFKPMPTRNRSAVQLLAWNMTWLTP